MYCDTFHNDKFSCISINKNKQTYMVFKCFDYFISNSISLIESSLTKTMIAIYI